MSTPWSYIVFAVAICVHGVFPASVGDCVSNTAGDIFGVVTVSSSTGVVIYNGRIRQFLETTDVVSSAPENCDDAYRAGQCVCTLIPTPAFAIEDGSLNQLLVLPLGTCYTTLKFLGDATELVAGMDFVKINDTQNAFVLRTNIGVDPTGTSCQSNVICTDDTVIKDSSNCGAVFVQNVPDSMISKGQFGDRCVYGIDDNLKYDEARAFCEDNDLKLVWVETKDVAGNVYEATGIKQYWVGLAKTSDGVWQWVSPDEAVDATSDVNGRWKGTNDDTNFDSAVIQGANNKYPLKGLPRTSSKNAVCEEKVTCSGYDHITMAVTLTLLSATLATLLAI